VEALLAFAAALLALRLAGRLAGSWRRHRSPDAALWAAGLAAYAVAAAAIAWGASAGWDEPAFRVYYLFGGLLTAPLLGAGSLARRGHRWAGLVALFYAGLAAGVALAEPLKTPVGGSSIPAAQHHFDFLPARLLALLGNGAGTFLLVLVAVLTLRARPLGNALVLAGVAVAAAGSALAGLGAAGTTALIALAVVLLYAGFVAPARLPAGWTRADRLVRAGRS